MLTTGFMVFLGVALLLVKLPRRLMLRLLRCDLAIDLSVSAVVLLIHFGTFSGVMAATLSIRSFTAVDSFFAMWVDGGLRIPLSSASEKSAW